MRSNTSISLGSHFESFVESSISGGRYRNASEVVRAGLRLLEEEEARIAGLRQAIEEGLSSGVAEGFDPKQHLADLKSSGKRNG